MTKPKPLADKVLNKADKLSLEQSDNNGDILLFTVVQPKDIFLRTSRIKPEGRKVKNVAHFSEKSIVSLKKPRNNISIRSFLGNKHKQPGKEDDNSHQIPGNSTRIHYWPTLSHIAARCGGEPFDMWYYSKMVMLSVMNKVHFSYPSLAFI